MYFMVWRYFFSSLVLWCSISASGEPPPCFFPDYLQGDYLMQQGSAQPPPQPVHYTEISITQDAISTWGYCLQKMGNDLYLIENLTNNSYCVRCFHISIKSPNILVARTVGNPDRCFVSRPSAESSCPKAEYFDVTKQIILYKTSKEIKRESCPLTGRYMVRYRQHKTERVIECASRTSDVSNCPNGSELKVHFQDCPFENHDLTFACLGTWNGPSNQQYIALYDTRVADEERPKYRCGLYLEDSGNGVVYIAFSSDSTCLTDLKSSQSGFESLVLTPYPNPPLQRTKCRFPNWLSGRWESVTLDSELNTLTYTDNVQFLTYTFQCLRHDVSERRYEFPLSVTSTEDNKILVHGRTHCGDELYTCLWLKSRGPNVFEFQLSKTSSQIYNETLCSSANFQPNVWITQARRDYLSDSPCPIVGEYLGNIPQTERLCAKLSSDCNSPDTMYYTVSDCAQLTYEDKRSGSRRYRQVDVVDIVEQTNNITSTTTTTPSNPAAAVSNLSNVVTSTAETPTATPTTTASSPNDSLAVESNLSDNVAVTETNIVRSYFVENRNLPSSIYEDARFDVPGKTFLPPPISSSTLPPVYHRPPDTHYNQYERPAYRQPPQYSSYPLRVVGGNEYYQTEERSRGSYYQEWNRSRPVGPPNGQMYAGEPNNNFERRNVIALPPRQLPAVTPRISLSPFQRSSFEDREYRCLGQWKENGKTYTFTERKNVGTFECFVGWPVSDTDFMIQEAGRHCERSDSSLLGMVLTKRSSCPDNRTNPTINSYSSSTPTVPATVVTTRPVTRRTLPPTTRSFPVVTKGLKSPSRSKTVNTPNNISTNNVPSQLLIIFLYYWCYLQ